MSTTFYVRSSMSDPSEEIKGPFTGKQLRELARQGKIQRTTMISKDKHKWVAAKWVQGLTLPPTVEDGLSSEYFYAADGQQYGPVSYAELLQLSKAGAVTPESLVWTDPWPEWKPAKTLDGLFDRAIPLPPPLPPPLPGPPRLEKEGSPLLMSDAVSAGSPGIASTSETSRPATGLSVFIATTVVPFIAAAVATVIGGIIFEAIASNAGEGGKRNDKGGTPPGAVILVAIFGGVFAFFRAAMAGSFKGSFGVPYTGSILDIAMSPTGLAALTCDSFKAVRLWDTESGRETKLLAMLGSKASPRSVAFTSNGSTAVCGVDAGIRVWDLATGKQTCQFDWSSWWSKSPQSVHQLFALPSNGELLMACDNGVWSMSPSPEVPNFVCRFRGHQGVVHALAICSDGRHAVSGGKDSTVRLWDIATGTEYCCLRGHTNAIRSVAVSSDSKRAVSGGEDATIVLWDLESGRELQRFQGHGKPVAKVAFVPGRERIVSCSEDGSVRLWDLPSGSEVHRFDEHNGRINALAVSPDGLFALTGGADKTIRRWTLDAQC